MKSNILTLQTIKLNVPNILIKVNEAQRLCLSWNRKEINGDYDKILFVQLNLSFSRFERLLFTAINKRFALFSTLFPIRSPNSTICPLSSALCSLTPETTYLSSDFRNPTSNYKYLLSVNTMPSALCYSLSDFRIPTSAFYFLSSVLCLLSSVLCLLSSVLSLLSSALCSLTSAL